MHAKSAERKPLSYTAKPARFLELKAITHKTNPHVPSPKITGIMKTVELNHVAIHVADVERSCNFYGNVMQLEKLPRPAFDFDGAWFRLGAIQELHIIGNRTLDVVAAPRGNHFALMVDHLDDWESHLRENDIEMYPRRVRPDGAQQLFLHDPDGHAIELCTPPD